MDVKNAPTTQPATVNRAESAQPPSQEMDFAAIKRALDKMREAAISSIQSGVTDMMNANPSDIIMKIKN